MHTEKKKKKKKRKHVVRIETASFQRKKREHEI